MRLTGIRSLSVFGAGAISSLCAAVGCGAVTAIRPQIAATAESTDALPAFSLPSTLGGELKSADVTQSSAVALVFYRGFW